MDQYSNLNVHGKITQVQDQADIDNVNNQHDVVLVGTLKTRVPAALPLPAAGNNGKAIISNGSGFEFGEAGKVDQVQVNGTVIAGDGTQTKIANIVPGTGLTSTGGTINHSNSIDANTSGVGSTTKIPVIKYDAQGHITSTSTVTVYPPTSVGTSGQIWQSDGSGVGVWQTLDTTPTANSTKAVTSGGIKTYVDNQVLLNTANFLGTYDVESDLGLSETATHEQVATKLGQMTWSPTPTKNDYVYIQFDLSSDPGVIDRYERYQYTGSVWEFSLEIQNPSFDTNQWAAINSGITSTKVGTYDTHVANTKIHVPTTTTAAMVLTSANNAAPVWRTISGSGYSTNNGNIVITDSHYTANLIANTANTSKTNATSAITNGNLWLNLVENDTVRNAHKIVGGGLVGVTRGASDNIITISDKFSATAVTLADM